MKLKQQKGFTIIELLVVIGIMGLMATLMVVQFNLTRSRRALNLAANELSTNIRKTQSYALSARDVAPSVPAKFYVLQFDFSQPSQYTILAVDTNFNSRPTLVENIKLDTDVVLNSQMSLVEQPINGFNGGVGTITHPSCIQVLFGLPFARTYIIGSSSCTTSYINTAKDPVALAALANSRAVIYLNNTRGTTYYKYSEINGLSGTIKSQ